MVATMSTLVKWYVRLSRRRLPISAQRTRRLVRQSIRRLHPIRTGRDGAGAVDDENEGTIGLDASEQDDTSDFAPTGESEIDQYTDIDTSDVESEYDAGEEDGGSDSEPANCYAAVSSASSASDYTVASKDSKWECYHTPQGNERWADDWTSDDSVPDTSSWYEEEEEEEWEEDEESESESGYWDLGDLAWDDDTQTWHP